MHRYYQPRRAGRAACKSEGIRWVRGRGWPGGLNALNAPGLEPRRPGGPARTYPGRLFGRKSGVFASGEPVDRVADQLGGILDPQLLLDALAVRFDGLDAQVECHGDFTCARALADEVQDLQLAIAQPIDWVERNVLTAGRKAVHQDLVHGIAHVDA